MAFAYLNIFYIMLSYASMNMTASLNVDTVVKDVNTQEDLPPSYEIAMGIMSESPVITADLQTPSTLNENATDQFENVDQTENFNLSDGNTLLFCKPSSRYSPKNILIVCLSGMLSLGIYTFLNFSVIAGLIVSVLAIAGLYFSYNLFFDIN